MHDVDPESLPSPNPISIPIPIPTPDPNPSPEIEFGSDDSVRDQGQRQLQRQRAAMVRKTGNRSRAHLLDSGIAGSGDGMARIKVRRTNREELPGLAVLRDAVAAELDAFPSHQGMLDLDMEIDPDLTHLITHDPDGFQTAEDKQETVGFAAGHVRSRQCVISEMWVLPQHRGRGAGTALMNRMLTYGERSGAREFLTLVPTEGVAQSLLLRHGFRPLAPVYQLAVPPIEGQRLGHALSRLMDGRDVTRDLYNRRGQADLDRIDRLTRNIVREADHQYWLKQRGYRAAFVRQGQRIAAYAYGGRDQIGPAAGTTREAALCALGWAVKLAFDAAGDDDRLSLRVPAPFTEAVDAALEAGCRFEATLMLYGRNLGLAFDRTILGHVALP
jgi:ribosomal protein S18 acetylase RimI-like enzyme